MRRPAELQLDLPCSPLWDGLRAGLAVLTVWALVPWAWIWLTGQALTVPVQWAGSLGLLALLGLRACCVLRANRPVTRAVGSILAASRWVDRVLFGPPTPAHWTVRFDGERWHWWALSDDSRAGQGRLLRRADLGPWMLLQALPATGQGAWLLVRHDRLGAAGTALRTRLVWS